MSTTTPAPDALPRTAATTAFALLALAVAHALINIQAAYPLRAITTGLLLVVAAVCALFATPMHVAFRGLRGRLAACAIASGVGVFAWTWFMQGRAPVPDFGAAFVSNAFQFSIALVAGFGAAAAWPRHARWSAPRTTLYALGVLITLIAAYGSYQVLAPEGWPRSYATMAAQLAASSTGNAMEDGVLSALREARAAGTFGAPNVFAGISATGCVLALACAWSSATGRARAAWLVATVVCGAGTILSGSRGGALALGAGLVVFVILAGAARRIGRGAALAAATLIVIATIPSQAQDKTPERSRWLGHTTVMQRVYYWQSGLAMWRESPVMGHGPASYATLYPGHRIAGSGETQFAHNWIVQSAVEGGVIGLALRVICFSAALALVLIAWRCRARDGEIAESHVLAGLGAAALTLILHGLVDYTLETREGFLLLGTLLGVASGCAIQLPESDNTDVPSWMRAARLGAFAAMAAALYSAHFMPMMQANRIQLIADMFAAGEKPQLIIEEATTGLGISPNDPRLLDARARARLALGDPRAAEDQLAALAANPLSASMHESLAMTMWSAGNHAEALKLIAQATALHPLDPSHWLTRAELSWNSGDKEGARDSLAKAAALMRSMEEETRLQQLRAMFDEAK